MLPNRVAVWLTALAALAGALAPAVADLDVSSTVGVVGGLAAITAVVRKWLEGWQQYEAFEFQNEVVDVPDSPGDAPVV